jgi:hypothetical protein
MQQRTVKMNYVRHMVSQTPNLINGTIEEQYTVDNKQFPMRA